MIRIATTCALLVLLLSLPGAARAAGCEVLAIPADRAECVARAQAREAARAEVRQRADGGADGLAAAPVSGRSAAWQRAVEESQGVDAHELLDARLLAAVGGLAWFAWAVRSRRRARRRAGP